MLLPGGMRLHLWMISVPVWNNDSIMQEPKAGIQATTMKWLPDLIKLDYAIVQNNHHSQPIKEMKLNANLASTYYIHKQYIM